VKDPEFRPSASEVLLFKLPSLMVPFENRFSFNCLRTGYSQVKDLEFRSSASEVLLSKLPSLVVQFENRISFNCLRTG